MDLRSERWRIRPLELPRPWRYCASCATARAFVCSERFRVNAQKKSLDVWLNYRCECCEDVWKFPLLERRSVSELGSALDDFARHDPATVWKYAFDIPRLRPHVIRIDSNVRVQVERRPLAGASAAPGYICIDFEVPFPCDIRLDRLLAGELGVSRSSLQVDPEQRDALRKRVRDRQRVYMLSKRDLTAERQNGGTSVL
ncbi:MAG TPA: DUF1062 domain-containing protein [Steroidobacteraceae bacterium]|jgi:hypothetical protein|nr:DUF1062 domain-containing protein [Steroidobacteraceae bacterium]